MLTCKEASHLASKAMEAKLSWRERLGLSLHLAMCAVCRRYVRDMKKLRRKCREIGQCNQALLPDSIKLSAQSKERIRKALRRASDQND